MYISERTIISLIFRDIYYSDKIFTFFAFLIFFFNGNGGEPIWSYLKRNISLSFSGRMSDEEFYREIEFLQDITREILAVETTSVIGDQRPLNQLELRIMLENSKIESYKEVIERTMLLTIRALRRKRDLMRSGETEREAQN